MEKIDVKEINLDSMSKLQHNGASSDIYINGDECIKIFTGYYLEDKINIYKKFMEIDGTSISNVLFPKILLMQDNILQGYIMDYFETSNLYDYFTQSRFIDINEILKATKKASLIIKELHKKNIICQDVSFDNFLIDKEGTIRLCDTDSFSYNGINGSFVSGLVANFIYNFKNQKIVIDYNLDRLSLLLAMYMTLYHRELEFLTKDQYYLLSDKIQTLSKLERIVKSLLSKDYTYIPYLDEIIEEEHYIIDRCTQVSKQRVLKNDFKIY